MNNLYKFSVKLLAALSLLAVVSVAQAEIAVIVHPGVKEIGLSKDKIADIYLDKFKTFADGMRIQPVDQAPNTAVRDKFYRDVLQMNASEVNRYWSRLRYTGKGTPPRVIMGDEAVRAWVASNPGAIGYIDGKFLDRSVKVVLILP